MIQVSDGVKPEGHILLVRYKLAEWCSNVGTVNPPSRHVGPETLILSLCHSRLGESSLREKWLLGERLLSEWCRLLMFFLLAILKLFDKPCIVQIAPAQDQAHMQGFQDSIKIEGRQLKNAEDWSHKLCPHIEDSGCAEM